MNKAISEMTYNEAKIDYFNCVEALSSETLEHTERIYLKDRAIALKIYMEEVLATNSVKVI